MRGSDPLDGPTDISLNKKTLVSIVDIELLKAKIKQRFLGEYEIQIDSDSKIFEMIDGSWKYSDRMGDTPLKMLNLDRWKKIEKFFDL